jgi:hypothetical protein
MMDFLISTKYTFACSLLQPKPLQSGLKLIPSRPSKRTSLNTTRLTLASCAWDIYLKGLSKFRAGHL